MVQRSAWLACALACACSTKGTTTQKVGAPGGVVTLADGTAAGIPAGALDTEVAVSIASNPQAPALAGDLSAVGATYLFGPEGTQFKQPVTVTLPFSADRLPAGASTSQIQVYTAPAGSGAYTALETVLVDGTHVAAQTSHFSNFVAAVAKKGVPDGGAGPDLSFSPSDLASSPADLALAADLAGDGGAVCFVICNSMAATFDGGAASGTRCQCSTTCAGHSYVLNCGQYQTSNIASCECTTDGTVIGTTTSTCAQGGAALYQPYKTTCGYPGMLPTG